MRLAATFARKSGKWVSIAGPDVPIDRQLDAFKSAVRSGKSDNDELWVFELARRRYQNFKRRSVAPVTEPTATVTPPQAQVSVDTKTKKAK